MSAVSKTVAPWRCDIGEHVIALEWAPHGKQLAVAGADGGVFLVQPHTKAPVRKLGEHRGGALSVCYLADGDTIASTGQDGLLHLYPAPGEAHAPAEKAYQTAVMPQSWVSQVIGSRDATYLAVAAGKYLVMLDARSLEICHQHGPMPSTIEAIALSPDALCIAVAAYGVVDLVSTKAPFASCSLPWSGTSLTLAWCPDNKVLAAGAQDASVQFWRLPEGNRSAMSGFASKIRALAWDSTGRWLATGGDCNVTLWDFRLGPEGSIPRMLSGHTQPVTALAWQHRGTLLASAASETQLLIWQPARNNQQHAWVDLISRPTLLRWSPDDRYLAVGGDSGEIFIFDPRQI